MNELDRGERAMLVDCVRHHRQCWNVSIPTTTDPRGKARSRSWGESPPPRWKQPPSRPPPSPPSAPPAHAAVSSPCHCNGAPGRNDSSRLPVRCEPVRTTRHSADRGSCGASLGRASCGRNSLARASRGSASRGHNSLRRASRASASRSHNCLRRASCSSASRSHNSLRRASRGNASRGRVNRHAKPLDNHIDLRIRHNVGRRQQHVIAPAPVNGPRAGVNQQPPLESLRLDPARPVARWDRTASWCHDPRRARWPSTTPAPRTSPT